MAAGEIRSGKAVTEIAAKDTLTGSLNRISSRFKSFAAGIKGVGGQIQGAFGKLALGGVIGEVFSVAGLGASIKAFSEAGKQLYFMSERTGMTVEALGKLKYAAEFSDTSIEGVNAGIKKMERFMGQASSGSKEATATLHKLGLNAAQLKAMSPDQQFEAIAKSIAKVKDPTEKAAMAMKVFGRGGTDLIPLIDHFEELSAEADKFGVMSAENAKNGKLFDDSMRHLTMAFKGIFAVIASTFVGELTGTVNRISDVIASVRKWVMENKPLVHSIISIGVKAAALGAAIIGVSAGVVLLGSVFAGMSSIVGVVGAVFSGLLGVIGAILSPIGLIAVAVVGLGGYFLYTSGMAGEAFEFIKSALGPLVADFQGAFGAMGNAIAAGDLKAAANVLWAFLKLEWVKGTSALRGYWNEFTGFFVEVWQEAVYSLASILTDAWDGVQGLWDNFITGLLGAWEIFSSTFMDVWKGIEKGLAKSFAWIMSFFDKDFEGASKGIEDDYAKQAAKRHGASDAKMAELGKANLDRQKQIAGDNAQKHAALKDQQARERAARASAAGAGVGEADEAYQKALKDFEDAKGAANAAKAPGGEERKPERTWDKAAAGVAAVGRTEHGGTFSASAAARFSSRAPIQERIAAATEKTAKNTKQLIGQGLGFA